MQSVIWNNPIHLAKWVNEKSNFIDHGIALCHGVFDILHEGHLAQFARAKELAPYVVVSITPGIISRAKNTEARPVLLRWNWRNSTGGAET